MVHAQRQPAAEVELAHAISQIREHSPHGNFGSLNEANAAVVQRMIDSEPWLVDVALARDVIPQFATRKLILHAGPPMEWSEMTNPARGAVLGAAMYEGWADDEASARRLAESGEIEFLPCHAVDAVGPMGGITSPSMAMFVVENRAFGNRGYCTINEGTGRVMRFGYYGPDVIERQRWMRDVLRPNLGAAARAADGIRLKPIATEAFTMGDEFHQRNVAASALFIREVAPWLAKAARNSDELHSVFRFIATTPQFFLNLAMAYGKVTVDAARQIRAGTVVTTMARNGVRFGIRMSGTGDRWFTGPVNTAHGVYFEGFTAEDGNPDIGDSTVTETLGWGGMSEAASANVGRIVGVSVEDGIKSTREMWEITHTKDPNFLIPALGFQGAPLGVDATRVVESGILPLINTGIAHKEPGRGQVGSGTVRPPMRCFVEAVRAYAAELATSPAATALTASATSG
jgi:hypothetical protein